MNRKFKMLLPLIIVFILSVTGCQDILTNEKIYNANLPESRYEYDEETDALSPVESNSACDYADLETVGEYTQIQNNEMDIDIPEYFGNPYSIINGNVPFFTEDEKQNTETFEDYSELDSLGRCGVAYANICPELMPTEKREGISNVKPSGWNNKPYDFVDGGYIYNRCHLIGFQLAGENANELNLITGTRSMNVDGMLPFENMVHDYSTNTGNHVLYRVTPIYDGDNLVANGVLMEAYSVEDSGEGILFNVFCYNVQPGCEINYSNGDNWEIGMTQTEGKVDGTAYIINVSSKKIHTVTCSAIDKIAPSNRQEYIGNINNLIEDGYSTCGICFK